MKRIAIHDLDRGFHPRWEKYAKQLGVIVERVDFLRPDVLDVVSGFDGVMWHFSHLSSSEVQQASLILSTIEFGLGKSVFPNNSMRWHFDDKIAEALLLKSLDVPIPENWIFWRKEGAMRWLDSSTYPLVFKIPSGAGSKNVSLVRSKKDAFRKVNEMFSRSGWISPCMVPSEEWSTFKKWAYYAGKIIQRWLTLPGYAFRGKYPLLPKGYWMPQKNRILFQEFIPDNLCDTRVVVIGNRAFAFRRFVREGDFRASGSGLIDYDPKKIDMRCVREAFSAAEKIGAQSIAFDFVDSERGPLVIEICYGYVSEAVHACEGHWDEDLMWQKGRMWPEEAHVIDFIEHL